MSRRDIYKISDAIELMPSLDTMTVRRVLRIAYDHWISMDDYIDPHPNRERSGDKLGLKHADDLIRYMASLDRNEPIFAVTDLLSTPRALKRLVSDVNSAWGRLKGEAELDDIIVVNVLLQGAERVIDFIIRNIDVARVERDRPFGRDQEAGPDRLETEWTTLLRELDHPRAVMSLVDLLGIRRLRTGHGITGDLSPQDVSNYEPTDYFRRILAGNISAGELRDQTVLRDIENWRAEANSNLIVGLIRSDEANERYARVFEHFAPLRLTRDELPQIASEIHRRILRRETATVIFQHVPAAIALWRLMNRGQRDRWTNWLIEEIRYALPISLLFASDLYNWHGSTRHGVVTADGRRQARAAMVEAARTIYTDANSLIRTLSLDQPFALTRFIAPPRSDEPDDTIPLEDLRWFAELVVDAGRVSAELIIQDVVITFGHFGNRFERGGDDAGMDLVQTYALDRDRFRRFFGESTSEMLRLIADFTTEIPVVIDAQRQIRQWFAEDENANPQ